MRIPAWSFHTHRYPNKLKTNTPRCSVCWNLSAFFNSSGWTNSKQCVYVRRNFYEFNKLCLFRFAVGWYRAQVIDEHSVGRIAPLQIMMASMNASRQSEIENDILEHRIPMTVDVRNAFHMLGHCMSCIVVTWSEFVFCLQWLSRIWLQSNFYFMTYLLPLYVNSSQYNGSNAGQVHTTCLQLCRDYSTWDTHSI